MLSTPSPDIPRAPWLSIVVEGYNSRQKLGEVPDLVRGLAEQAGGLTDVELVLVGTAEQLGDWRASEPESAGFMCVQYLPARDAHYYELKNLGANSSRADVIAFLDSDVVTEPGWLGALRGQFSDANTQAVAGITLFRRAVKRGGFDSTLLFCAASTSWGFTVPRGAKPETGTVPEANAFLSHNFALRREVFLATGYRADLGRTCAGSFLQDRLRQDGVFIRFAPQLRVAHNFDFSWWLGSLHRRFGHECYLLRRHLPGYPDAWLRRFGLLEPVVYWPYAVLLDVPRWWRFSRWTATPAWKRIACLPLVIGLSVLARASEALGMFATVQRPEAMREWAAEH